MRTHRHTAGSWSVFEASAAASMTPPRPSSSCAKLLGARLFQVPPVTCGCKLSTGVVWRAAIDSPGYSCEAESRPYRSSHLVVHYTKIFFCCNLARKTAARNAPKCHYSRLHRAGVFVPVVAHPIQNMSAVSITHKTVGNRLPCLWCGAVGRRTERPLTESNLLLPP